MNPPGPNKMRLEYQLISASVAYVKDRTAMHHMLVKAVTANAAKVNVPVEIKWYTFAAENIKNKSKYRR